MPAPTSQASQPTDTEKAPTFEGKPFRSSFKETVTVVVGTGAIEELFIVDRECIINHSNFFKAACDPKWSENKSNISLADHSPAAFKIYLEWVYGERHLIGFINTVAQAEAARHDTEQSKENDQPAKCAPYVLSVVCDLWNLGDYLNDTGFMTRITRSLHDDMDMTIYSGHSVRKVLANTPRDCKLQQFLIDYAVAKLSAKHVGLLDTCGSEFQIAVLNGLMPKTAVADRVGYKKLDMRRYDSIREETQGGK